MVWPSDYSPRGRGSYIGVAKAVGGVAPAHLTSREGGNAGDCREQSLPCARDILFIPQGTLSTISWSHLVLNIIGAAGRDLPKKKNRHLTVPPTVPPNTIASSITWTKKCPDKPGIFSDSR